MNRQLKKLTSLYWAQEHMKEAAAVCKLALSLSEEQRTDHVLFGLWTSIVVAYGRSFTQNDGISDLDGDFRTLAGNQQYCHDLLIEIRNNMHAHKSRLWEQKLAEQMGQKDKVDQVTVRVSETGETQWEICRPDFPIKYVSDVIDLCNIQIQRLSQASDKILKDLLEARSVGPGTYELGALLTA